MFDDRLEAGRLLAAELGEYGDSPDTLILALPRGGVVVGFAIHEALRLPLDVFITRKLRAPDNPEYALGALTETGYRYVNPDVKRILADSWGEGYLEEETEHQRLEITRRQGLYRNGGVLPELRGLTILLVDDGVATGSTVMAAVRGIRPCAPGPIVVAVPVGSPQAIETLRSEADDVVALAVPSGFMAVGEHYLHFPQVDDREVVGYLDSARLSVPRPQPGR